MKLHVELFGQDFAVELSVSLKVVEVSDQIGKNEHEETFKAEEMETAYNPFILLVSFDGQETGTRELATRKTNLSWAGKALYGTNDSQEQQEKRSQRKQIFTSIGTQNRPGLFMNPKT